VNLVLRSSPAGDLRSLPLLARKEKLREVLITADDDRLRYSEEFADPVKLLATVNKMRLEGVVSKRADARYRSGTQRDWIKVKARTWREANADRWESLQR
jgi:bifunctional non-homologous end joining protein LigD